MSHDLEERVREILSEPELVESLCLELARRAQRGSAHYVEAARLYSEDRGLSEVLRTMTSDDVHKAFLRSLHAITDDRGALVEALSRDLESGAGHE